MAFSYFFRDQQTLDMIREYVAPALRSRRYIHVWDAGCAMGPEPYSLAMTLREGMGPMIFRNVRIHATDIDISCRFADMIREGVYPLEQLKRIPQPLLKKYFESAEAPASLRVVEEIRKRIVFQRHDLLSLQTIRRGFVLVMCKNVLLHFAPEERERVLAMFYDALEAGGFLVTEQTQKLPTRFADKFQPVVSNAQLFRKI
jgi:chemotaxis protein methyltransferase CheR